MSVLLGKSKYFSIEGMDENGVIVNFSNGEKVTSSYVTGKGDKVVIGIGDERIKLYDGKILKRIRNNLIIE